jgi:hypothetical protein
MREPFRSDYVESIAGSAGTWCVNRAIGEGVEVGGEGNPWQRALEVVGVLLAVSGMMQEAIE